MLPTSQIMLFAFLELASSALSHMILANPVPYGSPNNSPLSPDGSDYPCKIGSSGSYQVKTMNQLQVSEQQILSFTGTVVHGGGSCQLAVTLDREPTKSSIFKVIYSIEGGCPGTSTAITFPWTAPSELPNGEATFAWTWFNKIGNREMYMDCAPITISGGANNTAAFEALPNLALCNIGNGCKTVESKDYKFKDPGKYATQIGDGPFVGLYSSAGSLVEPPENPQNPPATSHSSNNGPEFTQVLLQTSAQAHVEGPHVTSIDGTSIATTAPSAPMKTLETQATSATVPSSGDINAICTTDGELICNRDTQFGLCNHGKVIWQEVAAGTLCKNKSIVAKKELEYLEYEPSCLN